MTSEKELIGKTISKIKNYELECGDWDERIIWDDSKPPEKMPLLHLILNKNDPYFTFDDTTSLQDMIRMAKNSQNEANKCMFLSRPHSYIYHLIQKF